ncbi:hypothetical protein SYNTR_0888 [Candidatus Syntrophocurvum alkaliphilum]|uniref:Uncharacterized protein n=1 Tax=Candidatus Syntrophocurvum alkaliphilum TaxID=2293317 RepID=A0A6I6DJ29_9FIRM|nr:WYL domain-containing protein [Candidatus Syntrophocurvum alkaliphilum]QGT99481.1 hypothetical protein SYNTR_0888 [Candidatus Syntrophocurvum alkaliphilum]
MRDFKESSANKSFRIISLFEKLCQGEVINKKETAIKYQVNERTIQRDLEELRAYFSENYISDKPVELIYSNSKKGYILDKHDNYWLLPDEILAMSRILLESRAFPKQDLEDIVNKIIIQCEPTKRKQITEIISNELFHYIPVKHGKSIFNILWDISIAIKKQKAISIEYSSLASTTAAKRNLQPVGIVFSEYYFYLIAYFDEHIYEFPTIYRIDRIKDYTIKDEHFHIPYCDRFEEGEFRKRVQFMQTGKLLKIKFKYWGKSIEAILDRLPTAKVIEQYEEGKYILEAEVFGQGIKMWFLSQGDCLEVLEPKEFREEMKETTFKMKQLYK